MIVAELMSATTATLKMIFLVEQAGGAVINGVDTILDLQPQALHERVSVILGSKEEVNLLRQYHAAN